MVRPDGRFSVEPLAMWWQIGAREFSRQAGEILVCGGRPRDRLRDDEGSLVLDAGPRTEAKRTGRRLSRRFSRFGSARAKYEMSGGREYCGSPCR